MSNIQLQPFFFSDESTNGKENEWWFKDYLLYAIFAVVGCIVTAAASRYGLALLTLAEEAANPIVFFGPMCGIWRRCDR